MICTWKDCSRPARHPQLAKDGSEWANLCDEHHQKLDDAVASMDAKRLLGAWACAGKKHPARKKMNEDIAKGCGAIVALAKKIGASRGEKKDQ